MKYAFILCTAILFSSCKKESCNIDNYFVFGKAFGECGGNCATFFKVENGQVFADEMTYYTGTATFSNTPLNNAHYTLAQNLENNFPLYLSSHPDTTFGCPDCHDQGGIYFKKVINGVEHYWNIDTDTVNQPQAIRTYVQQAFAAIDSLD